MYPIDQSIVAQRIQSINSIQPLVLDKITHFLHSLFSRNYSPPETTLIHQLHALLVKHVVFPASGPRLAAHPQRPHPSPKRRRSVHEHRLQRHQSRQRLQDYFHRRRLRTKTTSSPSPTHPSHSLRHIQALLTPSAGRIPRAPIRRVQQPANHNDNRLYVPPPFTSPPLLPKILYRVINSPPKQPKNPPTHGPSPPPSRSQPTPSQSPSPASRTTRRNSRSRAVSQRPMPVALRPRHRVLGRRRQRRPMSLMGCWGGLIVRLRRRVGRGMRWCCRRGRIGWGSMMLLRAVLGAWCVGNLGGCGLGGWLARWWCLVSGLGIRGRMFG